MAEEKEQDASFAAILTRTLGDNIQLSGPVTGQCKTDFSTGIILNHIDTGTGLVIGAHSNIQDDQIICLTPPDKNHDAQWKLYYAAIERDNGQPARGKPESSTFLRILSFKSTPPDAIVSRYRMGHDVPLWTTSFTRPIVSILSGSEQAKAIYENLLAPFLRRIGASNTESPLFTSSANSVRDYTTTTIMPTAHANKHQLVILLAGDGGIVDLVNAAVSHSTTAATPFTPPTIALIPCGTGNALANSTSILPLAALTLGLRTLALGTAHPLPLLTARFSPPAAPYHAPDAPSSAPSPVAVAHAAVVVSWGLHAALVADSDTPAYRQHGAARFRLAAAENLFPADGSPPHAYRGQLALQLLDEDRAGSATMQESAWQPVPRTEHAYVLATLVSHMESRFAISPRSQPLDGILRIVHFGPMPGGGAQVMQVMGRAYDQGAHVAHVPAGTAGNVATAGASEVAYGAVRGVRIVFGEAEARWRRVCVDGKIFVVGEGGELVVGVAAERVVDLLHVD